MINKAPFFFVISLLFVGCEKENFYWNLRKKPVVVTFDELLYSSSDMSLLIKGEVLKDEGNLVTKRGVVWSNSENPTLADNFTSNGTGIGIFTDNITGLVENATYYIRTYATNSIGTSYGEVRIFKVPNKTPILSTTFASNITSNSATSGGTISSEGESPIIQRGVVWSNSPNPTLSDNFTSNGTGSGLFSSNITGLSASTKYYIRAYATNSFGTSYGNQIEIQTMDPVPVLISTNPCNSLSGINSSYIAWNGVEYYNNFQWSINQNGNVGDCYISQDGNLVSNNAMGGFIEFPILINGNGYICFWMDKDFGPNNNIPDIYVDGLQLSLPTIIVGQSEYDWKKLKTSTISDGNHMLKISWDFNQFNTNNFKIDEIEIWEYH
jgi:hypothetical protein